MDDLEKEHQKEVKRLLAEIKYLKKENLKLAAQRDEAKDKYRERNSEYYAIASELLDEHEKSLQHKLTVILRIHPYHPPCRRQEEKRFPTAVKKQEENRVPSRDIRDTAGKSIP